MNTYGKRAGLRRMRAVQPANPTLAGRPLFCGRFAGAAALLSCKFIGNAGGKPVLAPPRKKLPRVRTTVPARFRDQIVFAESGNQAKWSVRSERKLFKHLKGMLRIECTDELRNDCSPRDQWCLWRVKRGQIPIEQREHVAAIAACDPSPSGSFSRRNESSFFDAPFVYSRQ